VKEWRSSSKIRSSFSPVDIYKASCVREPEAASLRGACHRKTKPYSGSSAFAVRRASAMRRTTSRGLLPFLLVAILAESLLPLVGSNLVALALTTGGHRFGSRSNVSGANEDRRQSLSIQTLTHPVARTATSGDSATGSFNPLFTAAQLLDRRTASGFGDRSPSSNLKRSI